MIQRKKNYINKDIRQIGRKFIKIILLGDSCVGKTTLLNIFSRNKFLENTLATRGIDKLEIKIKLNKGKEMRLFIYDTPGEEKYHSIAIHYVHSSDGVMIVFDLTKKDSFENVKVWLKDTKEIKDCPIVLFGSKCDIIDRREISKEEAEKFANSHKLPYFEISAKENINIKKGLEKIANDAYEFPIYQDNNINENIHKSRFQIKTDITKFNILNKFVNY